MIISSLCDCAIVTTSAPLQLQGLIHGQSWLQGTSVWAWVKSYQSFVVGTQGTLLYVKQEIESLSLV